MIDNKILILFSVFFLSLLIVFKPNVPTSQRFEIVVGGFAPTILLDRINGQTWRNITCPEYDSKGNLKKNSTLPPNCWEKMTTEEGLMPIYSEKIQDLVLSQGWPQKKSELLKMYATP